MKKIWWILTKKLLQIVKYRYLIFNINILTLTLYIPIFFQMKFNLVFTFLIEKNISYSNSSHPKLQTSKSYIFLKNILLLGKKCRHQWPSQINLKELIPNIV